MKRKVIRLIVCLLIFGILTFKVTTGRINENSQKAETKCLEQIKLPEQKPSIDQTDETEKETVDTMDADNGDIQLSYHVTDQWDDYYSVEVTLKNTIDEKIDDWEICIPANYEIEKIWNAKVNEHANEMYKIQNAGENQDILENGSVTFGMVVMCQGELQFPRFCEPTRRCIGVTNKYKVEYTNCHSGKDKANGKITITNLGDETIEDWKLLIETNFKIKDIKDAVILEQIKEEDVYYYDIDNCRNNQNIEPKQSVEFAFIAKYDGKPKVLESELCAMVEYTDEVREACMDIDLGSEDNDYEDDECIFDADSFDTAEAYEEYIEELQRKGN